MPSNHLTPELLALLTRLAPFKKNTWLPIVEARTGSVLNSKFSGIPLLDQHENWPCCGNCHQPMQLFLQLNSADLPENLHTILGGGILQAFYCLNLQDNCEIACEAFFPFSKSTLVRLLNPDTVVAKQITVPPVASELEEKVIVGWQMADDYPNTEELDALGLELTEDEREIFWGQENYPRQGDKLSGWPFWVQGVEYPQCPDCGAKMNFIFQIDSERNLDYMFGDSGCAHITQCPNHPQRLTIAWACY